MFTSLFIFLVFGIGEKGGKWGKGGEFICDYSSEFVFFFIGCVIVVDRPI